MKEKEIIRFVACKPYRHLEIFIEPNNRDSYKILCIHDRDSVRNDMKPEELDERELAEIEEAWRAYRLSNEESNEN